MLAGKVEDMINTVVRQIAFYTFERKVHIERREGELTAERLGEIWLEVQNESLGPAIELKPGYETFWTYIPHFVHSPFYVYAYAFGDCLVNSLYAVYERAAEGFAERYLAMLSAGGTKHHAELLKPFGLDARDPAFWQGGLTVIEGMIRELEALDRRGELALVCRPDQGRCALCIHNARCAVKKPQRNKGAVVQIRKIGNSLGLILPKAAARPVETDGRRQASRRRADRARDQIESLMIPSTTRRWNSRGALSEPMPIRSRRSPNE